MIPIQKETQIHKMIFAGAPTGEIAEAMGVSASTVRRIRVAIRLSENVESRRKARVRLLTMGGLSQEAISAKLKLPVNVVKAIKRTQFLLASVVESPHPCPTCGNVMLPDEKENEHEITETPKYIRAFHATELFILADEVVGLAKAETVRNMLFYDIADRAERLLANITGENYAEEESDS